MRTTTTFVYTMRGTGKQGGMEPLPVPVRR